MRSLFWLLFVGGAAIGGFSLGRKTVRCVAPRTERVSVGRGVARSLLRTEEAIHKLRPILEPMEAGRLPGPDAIRRALT